MSDSDILSILLQQLWVRYKARVPYAARYEAMVEEKGGNLQNDHLAFRTLNCPLSAQPSGVAGIARIFEALGYVQKDNYVFADKHLDAWHWEHSTNPKNPKIFISQLEVDQLSPTVADDIKKAVASAVPLITSEDFALLKNSKSLDASGIHALVGRVVSYFGRAWKPPERSLLGRVDRESQYGAWTLLHGNAVNHFTAYINEQNVKDWPDIETTVDALRAAGVPMKDEFEGERGTKLRQSSTKASVEEVAVTEDDGTPSQITWSYAYYELAERGMVPDASGNPVRFQGFLGAQATNLFEMTKRD